MRDRVVLDSWAVLELLDRGSCADAVEEIIESGRAVMSWINLGEVAYRVHRRHGKSASATAVADVRYTVDVHLPDPELVLQAAGIKAQIPMAYADAFCAATALRLDAPLLTGDPELLRKPKRGTGIKPWKYVDLR